MTNAPRILIACIGNIFLGDDGFGVEVARRLAGRRFPPGVEVVDFGIRGVELAYTLLDGCDTLVLVDAVPRGGAPGTVYLLELPTPADDGGAAQVPLPDADAALDAHSMNPMKTLAFAYQFGARPGRAVLVGCEPEAPPTADADGDAEMRMGLSAPAQAAVEEAVKLLDDLVGRLYSPVAATGATGASEATDTQT